MRFEPLALRDAQTRAARARIALDLFIARADEPADELQARPRVGRDVRQSGVHLVAARFASHEALDDPVLERVEADHEEPPAGREQLDGLRQRALERGELGVDGYSDRLERARGRMNPALLASGVCSDEICESARRRDRRGFASADDCGRDLPRALLFSVAEEHVR